MTFKTRLLCHQNTTYVCETLQYYYIVYNILILTPKKIAIEKYNGQRKHRDNNDLTGD